MPVCVCVTYMHFILSKNDVDSYNLLLKITHWASQLAERSRRLDNGHGIIFLRVCFTYEETEGKGRVTRFLGRNPISQTSEVALLCWEVCCGDGG